MSGNAENNNNNAKTKAQLKAERKAAYEASKQNEVSKEKKTLTKSERRAQQEAQRAAKEASTSKENKKKIDNSESSQPTSKVNICKDDNNKQAHVIENQKDLESMDERKVYLFEHLKQPVSHSNVLEFLKLESCSDYHENFIKLAKDIGSGALKGATERCVAFISATCCLIKEYEVTSGERFSRTFMLNFVNHVNFIEKIRPLPIPIQSFVQYVKQKLVDMDQMDTDEDCGSNLLDLVESFEREQITLAAKSIMSKISSYIKPGEYVCTFAYSWLVSSLLRQTWAEKKQPFSVLVVDQGPDWEGRRMLSELVKAGVPCQYTLLNALPSIAENISLVLLGVHGLLSNGHVLARMGSAQFASCLPHAPVLVCAETYKFCDRAQTDAFEYNELASPDTLLHASSSGCSSAFLKSDWRSTHPNLHLLHLEFDVIPSELVTAVVTELGILPTSSVPVILRVKQSSLTVA